MLQDLLFLVSLLFALTVLFALYSVRRHKSVADEAKADFRRVSQAAYDDTRAVLSRLRTVEHKVAVEAEPYLPRTGRLAYAPEHPQGPAA